MKKGFIAFAVIVSIVSCTGKSSVKKFQVSGFITNNTAKMIYLEEIPVATMQLAVMDSAALDKDGKYILKTNRGEASVFNLRLDQNAYPLTSIINDTSAITVNVTMNKDNRQFAESYEVKGSIASQQMKDFMYSINKSLQKIFLINRRSDSLIRSGNSTDSVKNALLAERTEEAGKVTQLFSTAISRSDNPALTMFELSYYQGAANNPGNKIQAINNEEVSKIVDDVAARFPEHTGVAAVKRSLDAELKRTTGLKGKQAPEIVLPDVNGKEVRLSSFRGKYVLVDFWASWCGPCRRENPNVVKAYNRFRNKNFAILGVSLDRPGGKNEWVRAIMEDNLTWTQVSDLKEWESVVVPLYNFGEEGIPYNVLVDPAGKIIAERLRGPELEAKLEEVLK